MLITDKVVLFYTASDYQSNFYIETIYYKRLEFFCTEQLFMWRKARHFGDTKIANDILNVHRNENRAQLTCKEMGRAVSGYDEGEWNEARFPIMLECAMLKYTQHPNLTRELLSTGKRLIAEASKPDVLWGIGLGEHDPRAQDPANWTGLNLLGKVHMVARNLLEQQHTPIDHTTIYLPQTEPRLLR